MKTQTVQLHYYDNNTPIAVTATGRLVDVGLPEGHTAIAHKVGKLWQITHVQSGETIMRYKYTMKQAIIDATFIIRNRKNIETMLDKEALKFKKYLAALWQSGETK